MEYKSLKEKPGKFISKTDLKNIISSDFTGADYTQKKVIAAQVAISNAEIVLSGAIDASDSDRESASSLLGEVSRLGVSFEHPMLMLKNHYKGGWAPWYICRTGDMLGALALDRSPGEIDSFPQSLIDLVGAYVD